jgi:hypothetical protein
MNLRLAPAFALTFFLAGCGSTLLADPEVSAKFTLDEAKELIQREYRWFWGDGSTEHAQAALKFTPERIEVIGQHAEGQKFGTLVCPFEEFSPHVDEDAKTVGSGRYKGAGIYNVHAVDKGSGCSGFIMSVSTLERAKTVAAAFLRWKGSTRDERQVWYAQQQRSSAATRSAQDARSIPDEVKRLRAVAEQAVREMRFADAADAYLDGLKVAPAWAEGQFNAALVLGEIYFYDDAIIHMRRYLALVPNAPDARAVQNKISAWENAERSMQSGRVADANK